MCVGIVCSSCYQLRRNVCVWALCVVAVASCVVMKTVPVRLAWDPNPASSFATKHSHHTAAFHACGLACSANSVARRLAIARTIARGFLGLLYLVATLFFSVCTLFFACFLPLFFLVLFFVLAVPNCMC